MYVCRSIPSVLLCSLIANSGVASAQEAAATIATPQKYKLTIIEGASTVKRVKKGRVSSQKVVKVTDENDVPVPGIAVSFTIPQLNGSGAGFANGGLTSIATTNAAGVAPSGTFVTAAGSSFSMSVTASVPGGVALTATVPVTTTAVAATAAGAGAAAAAGAVGGATAGGISTGVIVGIVVGVGAAAAAGVAVATKSNNSNTPSPSSPQGTIGSPGTPTFGR